jgi:hypothetical protein
MSVLLVFGVSFLIRGISDTYQNYSASASNAFNDVMLVVLYFGCEWLPIFFIMVLHWKDFGSASKRKGFGEKSHVMPVQDAEMD